MDNMGMSEVGFSDLTLHQALQNLRVAEGDEPASPTPFDRLLISYPDAVGVMRERARAREAAQNWHTAAEDYARVLEVLPDDAQSMTSLARCQMRADNAIEGKITALQALDHDPANRDAILFVRMAGDEIDKSKLGELAHAQEKYSVGQTQRAIKQVKDFVARDPERMDAQVVLARLLWQSGRHIAAMDVCQRILDHAPDCLFAHVLLRQFWLMARNPGQADLYLAEIDRLDPDHRICAENFGDLAAALTVKDAPAERAIRQMPAYMRNEERADEDAQDRAAWVDELAASSAMLRTKVQPVFSAEEGPVADYFPLDWSPVPIASAPEAQDMAAPALNPPQMDEVEAAPQPISPPQDAPVEAQHEPEVTPDEETPPWDETPAQVVVPQAASKPAPPAPKAALSEWVAADEAPAEPGVEVAPAPARSRLVTPRPRRAAAAAAAKLEVAPSEKKKASENLIAAREAAAKGNYAFALKQIEVVVNRGKKPRETVTMLEDVIERLNPRSQKTLLSEAYQLLSVAYTQAGRPDDALEALQRK